MPPEKEGSFSLEDIRALRYLALVVGVVTCGLFLVAGPGGTVVVTLFIVGNVLAVGGVLYGLRRLRLKKERMTPPLGDSGRSAPQPMSRNT